MKKYRLWISVLFVLICHLCFPVRGQGTFQNLGFESATIPQPQPPGGYVPLSDAFPGWTGYIHTNQTALAGYNFVSAGGAVISLITPTTPSYGDRVIAGNYTATLSAGYFGPPVPVSVSIAQSSLVPVMVQSLRFSASSFVGDLTVTFNGQNIPFYPLGAGPNYQNYGANIGSFAGQTGELRFTENPGANPFAFVWLDDIFFSPAPIPEPSVLGLFGLGAVLLGWRFVRARR